MACDENEQHSRSYYLRYFGYTIACFHFTALNCTTNDMLITGPPRHSVGARLVTVAGVCRRLSTVVVCNTRICNVTHQWAA